MSVIIAVALGAVPAHGATAPSTVAGPGGRTPLRTWTYAADPSNKGTRAGFAQGRFPGRTVSVPHSANAAKPGTDAQQAAYRGAVGWYRRTMTTSAGTYVLRFESVASIADVYVDGRHLARHLRAYEPFEVRARLAAGSHRIVVRADWRSPARQDKLGLHRTWFNWGGMDREATIRKVGRSEISDLAATTKLAPDGSAQVTVRARVTNDATETRTLPVVARLQPPGGGPAQMADLGRPSLAAKASKTVSQTITVAQPRLWQLGDGQLYDLDVAVPLESTEHARIGLRQVSWDDGELQINGKRAVLRGASVQEDVPGRGDALRPADMARVVAHLKAVGANATRAQHPLSPGLLERLDAAGIAVWQQIGPVDSPGEFTSTTPELARRARADVRHDLDAARLHPSIVAWSLGTEVAFNGAPGQASFVDQMAQELHRSDPGRGVSVDVWTDHVPDVPGPLYSHLDAVGVTSYFGWYENTFATFPQQSDLVRARVAQLRQRFADKAVVVAELGAEGTPSGGDQRGGRGYQSSLLSTQLTALQTAPGLSGAFVWLLGDFQINPSFRGGSITKDVPGIKLVPGLNQKGLFDYAGRAKPSASAVAGALQGWPQ